MNRTRRALGRDICEESMGALARGTERAKETSPCPFTGLRAGGLPCGQGPGPRCATDHGRQGLRKDGLDTATRWRRPKEPPEWRPRGTTLFKARLSGGLRVSHRKKLSVRAARVTIYWVQGILQKRFILPSDLQSHPAMEVL